MITPQSSYYVPACRSVYMKVEVKLLSRAWLLVIACQAPPLSVGFPRQEYWSGEPVISSPGDLPDPRIELRSPTLQADSLPTELQGKPNSLAHVKDHPKLGHLFPTSYLSLAKGYDTDDGGSRWRTVKLPGISGLCTRVRKDLGGMRVPLGERYLLARKWHGGASTFHLSSHFILVKALWYRW